MGEKSSTPGPSVEKDIGTAAAHSVSVLAGRGSAFLSGLIAAVAKGDQGALRRLYDQTSGLVNALALRILGNAADAEEVVMDVFAKAWRSAGAFDEGRGSALAWLLVMTRSLAVDRLRQRGSRPKATEDIAAMTFLASSDAGPETLTIGEERRRVVQDAISQLPEEQRQVLRLAYYGGFSHSELAEQLGQPLGTVKTRIRLGLQHMRRLLEESN